jgi:hypothetical protein
MRNTKNLLAPCRISLLRSGSTCAPAVIRQPAMEIKLRPELSVRSPSARASSFEAAVATHPSPNCPQALSKKMYLHRVGTQIILCSRRRVSSGWQSKRRASRGVIIKYWPSGIATLAAQAAQSPFAQWQLAVAFLRRPVAADATSTEARVPPPGATRTWSISIYSSSVGR